MKPIWFQTSALAIYVTVETGNRTGKLGGHDVHNSRLETSVNLGNLQRGKRNAGIEDIWTDVSEEQA